MADTVDTIVLKNTKKRYIVRIVGICDGTGESNVVKVDKSTLVAEDGAEPAALDLVRVQATVGGHVYVLLEWDHATDEIMLLLPTGTTVKDYSMVGVESFHNGLALEDPSLADSTGDILLTTSGNVSGNTYDIVLEFIKRPATNAIA